jgi:hypothetical protein
VTTIAGEVEIAYPVLLFDGKYLFVPSQHDNDEKLRRAITACFGNYRTPISVIRGQRFQ